VFRRVALINILQRATDISWTAESCGCRVRGENSVPILTPGLGAGVSGAAACRARRAARAGTRGIARSFFAGAPETSAAMAKTHRATGRAGPRVTAGPQAAR